MRTLRFKRLAWLTGAIATIGLAFAAACTSAATIGGFGVRPAHPNPNVPATRAYFIVHAGPGSLRQETVVVTNDSAKPLVLAVDAVDGLTGVTSGVVYANRGVPIHGAGAWVTPAVRRVTVPAHSSLDVGFTVKVPKAAPAGDHVAGIAFQALQGKKSAGHFAVTVVDRTVVGIEFEVPGHATQDIRLFSLALAPLPGTTVPSVVVTLEDVGRKLCQPQLTLAIQGQAGANKATRTLETILPGDKIAYPFRWPGSLREGSYDVSATATRCGPQAVMHAVATYSPAHASSNYPSTNLGPTAPLARNGWSWWLYVLIGLGAFVVLGLLLRYVPRRDARP
jgi:Bacterial protein of unknown function (DUF916)